MSRLFFSIGLLYGVEYSFEEDIIGRFQVLDEVCNNRRYSSSILYYDI